MQIGQYLDNEEVRHHCHSIAVSDIWHFLCFHLKQKGRPNQSHTLECGIRISVRIVHFVVLTLRKTACRVSFASSANTSSSCLHG